MQNSDGCGSAGDGARPARGRPRGFDREAALGHATRLFWSKGYEATSIADLTKAMGIGSPSLYAAFGSKEALYAEALRCYHERNEPYFWTRFNAAATAREAFDDFLMDSSAALTGCVVDNPRGCMVALSSVGSEGHEMLGELVRASRNETFARLKRRLDKGVSDGDVPAGTDTAALARFVQIVQNGMSILARDGATRADLEEVAVVAMLGWNARVRTEAA